MPEHRVGFVHARRQPRLRTDVAAITALSMPQITGGVPALQCIVPATLSRCASGLGNDSMGENGTRPVTTPTRWLYALIRLAGLALALSLAACATASAPPGPAPLGGVVGGPARLRHACPSSRWWARRRVETPRGTAASTRGASRRAASYSTCTNSPPRTPRFPSVPTCSSQLEEWALGSGSSERSWAEASGPHHRPVLRGGRNAGLRPGRPHPGSRPGPVLARTTDAHHVDRQVAPARVASSHIPPYRRYGCGRRQGVYPRLHVLAAVQSIDRKHKGPIGSGPQWASALPLSPYRC